MVTRPSLYEFAGGEPAFLALATAHHARCLADPELNHPFSHDDQHPQHVERLATYWAEVLGRAARVLGRPATTSRRCCACTPATATWAISASASSRCFVAAFDDAGLPADPEFRAAMSAYMRWAVDEFLSYPEREDVPSRMETPRWSWDGLVPAEDDDPG